MLGQSKGLSTIVATLLMILLTLVLIGIVWTVVKSLVEDSLPEQSCLNIFEKVSFNQEYTCYNSSAGELQFSINLADVAVQKVIISITGEGTMKSLEIKNESSNISYVKPYQGNYSQSVKLPSSNSGLTYVYNASGNGFLAKPNSIKISPVMNGKQCDVSDSILEISNC
jgi:FlaG/FlaF family flagellin (archaellin)